jgi:ATP-binding cassette subfamily C protein
MRKLLTIFFRSRHANPWTVFAALSASALAEGVGLASFLPIISIILDQSDSSSLAYRVVENILSAIGLSMTTMNLLAVVVGAISVKALLTVLAMNHVGGAVALVSTGLRTRLLNDIMRARWSYFVDQPLGRIANTMSGDATRAGQSYLLIAIVLTNMLRTVVLIVVAITISWQVALLAIAFGGGIALALNSLVRISKRAGDRQTSRTAELVIYLSDALNNIKPLKAMNKQASFSRLFAAKIEKLRKAQRMQVVASETRKGLEEILTVLCFAGGLVVATRYADVKASSLLVIGVVLLQTVDAIGKVQAYLQKALIFQSAFLSAQTLVDETEAAREEHAGKGIPTLRRDIELADVAFAHGDAMILNGVDLRIPKGEILVITGPSGSGKTTIIDLILGLHMPLRGEVRIDGVALERLDVAAWRGMVGYVSQELSLFHDTVRANVTLGDPTISDAEVRAALTDAGAWSYVEALPEGLDTEVGEKGTRLSGGQRQRIALARALAFRPALLILDEVTSALDADSEADICRRIAAMRGGMTIVAVTHRPALLAIADRIIALEGGRIAAETTPEAAAEPA